VQAFNGEEAIAVVHEISGSGRKAPFAQGVERNAFASNTSASLALGEPTEEGADVGPAAEIP
jgi:hypothetical protein